MPTDENLYPRDLVGYANELPAVTWPGKARIAVQFVINYEEGGENTILNGDTHSEAFLSEIIGAQKYPGQRHVSMESIYEFGSRVGFWRLHQLFTEREIPVTVFAVAKAMAENPKAVDAMLAADWEIASHGLRWIDYIGYSYAQEAEHVEQAVELHQQLTGEKPKGFYQGRTGEHTLKIIADRGDFVYHADSYSDELPYWDDRFTASGKAQLIVPYTLDVNDMRFASPQGFNSGEQFYQYLKDSFDCLYAEGEHAPKMLSIGLHCRLTGRPGRIQALKRFIDYALSHEQVWFTTRLDIAKHWQENHPYQA